jgi:hypothetical protein
MCEMQEVRPSAGSDRKPLVEVLQMRYLQRLRGLPQLQAAFL